MIITDCHRVVGGKGLGPALMTGQPINFLAMVDAETGVISDKNHELHGRSVKGTVLIFPCAVGSSVGAYAIYSLKESGSAPNAIICSKKADITTASGCAIARIPVVDLPPGTDVAVIRPGAVVRVDATESKATVTI